VHVVRNITPLRNRDRSKVYAGVTPITTAGGGTLSTLPNGYLSIKDAADRLGSQNPRPR
jgi:hypothetical protein